MTQIFLTGLAGFLFLVGFSLLFVWLDDRSKKRTRNRMIDRFQYFDKYYTELETESEKNLEKKRKERMDILGYDPKPSKDRSGNIDISRLSGNAAI
jgi:hypothetical protein